MLTIKKTLILTILLASLLSCSESEEDRQEATTGKVLVSTHKKETEVVELTNGRQQHLTKDGKPWITIKKGNGDDRLYNEVIIDGYMDESGYYELEVGDYSAFIKQITQEGKYKDGVEADSEYAREFNILAGQETKLHVELLIRYVVVYITLEGLDGATVWVGEEGFTPDHSYLNTEDQMVKFFVDNNRFEVVVEYQGKTKRYGARADIAYLHFVTITNKTEETGSATFTWEIIMIEDHKPNHKSFEW